MGKIATKGWINDNKKDRAFPPSAGNQCPTRSEITSITGFTVGSGYASNQLVQEISINYRAPGPIDPVDPDPPIGGTFKIVGQQFSGYYVSRTSYVTSGTMLLSPITLRVGDSLSSGFTFEFNQKLYVRNVNTGAQQMIDAAQNRAGNTVNLTI